MGKHSLQEVLELSGHVLEIDGSSNFVAYEYHAAANLNLHDLAAAEKSDLRAAELDREHREPRIYFVLAQIYEAKGDFAEVAAQLRSYLKYTDSPLDAAWFSSTSRISKNRQAQCLARIIRQRRATKPIRLRFRGHRRTLTPVCLPF